MTPVLATFMEEGKSGSKFDVHFNPASLKLAVSNTIPDEGGGSQTKAKSASKLDLELVFDSTEDGKDVRETSNKLKALGFLTESTKALPKVVFEWGTFAFTGVIESLNETFEFFSGQGVPLRETMAVSMKGLKLDEKRAQQQQGGSQGAMIPPGGGSQGTTGVAQSLGNPAAGRGIAAQNGLESMRFPGSASLAVGADVSLKGPAGLSLPEGGLSIQAGGVFGGQASARVTASAGAFAGLGPKVSTGNVLKLQLDSIPSFSPVISGGRSFDLSGRISPSSGASFNVK
jgi:Contractile injection system tube protein